MKTSFIFLTMICVFYSCVSDLSEEEFTMIRTPYDGNKIRFDGFYLVHWKDYPTCENLTFYRNGVVLSFNYDSSINNIYNNNQFIESIRTNKRSWGIYKIINDTVFIQQKTLNEENTRWVVINFRRKIVNDTTLTAKGSDGGLLNYQFYKFSPKPDSTNVFIK